MNRNGKIMALILGAVLILVSLDAKLAQPEKYAGQGDRFIGFHLVYEHMPQSMDTLDSDQAPKSVDYSLWTEYGYDNTYLSGLGSVSFPRMILMGEKVGNRYIFPGLEGKNCFLAEEIREDGSHAWGGYTDVAEGHVDIGGQTQSVSGTVYYGPPLDDSTWNTENFAYGWTAYRVYQMTDGTVYLDGSGNSYGGVGGFSFSEKSEWTTTENGETSTQTFEVSVTIDSLPRLDNVTVRQLDQNDRELRTDVLTSRQAAFSREEPTVFPLESQAEYIIVTKTDNRGNAERELLNVQSTDGTRRVYLDPWFLDENGDAYLSPIWLTEGGAKP